MRSLKHDAMLYLCAVLFLAIAMVGTTTNAFAAGLTETGPANVSAGAVTLNGVDQTTTYALGLTVSDQRSNNNGWNLTITSTTFTAGSHTLSTTASSIKAVPTAVCSGSCTLPTNSVTYAVGVPAASTAPTPVKFFNAAAHTGVGTMTITPTVTISIPANTMAGSYTSTVTIAITGGP